MGVAGWVMMRGLWDEYPRSQGRCRFLVVWGEGDCDHGCVNDCVCRVGEYRVLVLGHVVLPLQGPHLRGSWLLLLSRFESIWFPLHLLLPVGFLV